MKEFDFTQPYYSEDFEPDKILLALNMSPFHPQAEAAVEADTLPAAAPSAPLLGHWIM